MNLLIKKHVDYIVRNVTLYEDQLEYIKHAMFDLALAVATGCKLNPNANLNGGSAIDENTLWNANVGAWDVSKVPTPGDDPRESSSSLKNWHVKLPKHMKKMKNPWDGQSLTSFTADLSGCSNASMPDAWKYCKLPIESILELLCDGEITTNGAIGLINQINKVETNLKQTK